MEVKTIQEVKNLITKALGPWHDHSLSLFCRTSVDGESFVQLINQVDNDHWELRIFSLGIDYSLILQAAKKYEATAEADRILRKKGYVLFDE